MKKVCWWILTILWMAFIFYMSHQTGDDSSRTSLFLANTISIIIPFFDENLLIIFIRKTAHFTEFFILMFLMHKSFSVPSISNPIEFASIFTILYAILDEFHQYFIPGRSSSVLDILIDSFGVFVYLVIIGIFRKPNKNV